MLCLIAIFELSVTASVSTHADLRCRSIFLRFTQKADRSHNQRKVLQIASFMEQKHMHRGMKLLSLSAVLESRLWL